MEGDVGVVEEVAGEAWAVECRRRLVKVETVGGCRWLMKTLINGGGGGCSSVSSYLKSVYTKLIVIQTHRMRPLGDVYG